MKGYWRVLAALMLAETVGTVSLSIVFPGLGSWLRMFGDPAHVGWIMSAYLLVSAAAAALCGRLGDIFGARRVLVAVTVLVLIGSVVSALGSGLVWIIIGRGLQGVGGAVLPLVYALVRQHLPTGQVPFGIGMIVAAASASSACSLLVGGVLTDLYGPQSLFWAIALLTIVSLAVTLSLVPSRTASPSGTSIDWLGGILFAPGLAALLVALSNGRSWGWGSVETLGSFALGIALLAVWHWHERRQAEPLIDLRLLGGHDRALANLVMVAIALGVMQLTEVTALLLQQPSSTGVGLDTSATLVGLIKFPAVACGVIGSIWAGWIASRRGARVPMVAGAALMLVSSIIAIVDHSSVVIVFLFVALGMTGITASYAAIPIVIVNETAAERVGEATGLMAVIRAVSQGVGAQRVAIMLASSTIGQGSVRYPSANAYLFVFIYMVAAALAALILAFAIRPRGSGRRPAGIREAQA